MPLGGINPLYEKRTIREGPAPSSDWFLVKINSISRKVDFGWVNIHFTRNQSEEGAELLVLFVSRKMVYPF